MKRKRYSEEKIISILEEHQAGASVPALLRLYGIAENTIYRWKSKFGGTRNTGNTGTPTIQRFKMLEHRQRFALST
jgi:transposase-like protein